MHRGRRGSFVSAQLAACAAVLSVAGCATTTGGAGSPPSDDAGWQFQSRLFTYPLPSQSDATLGGGELTIKPHTPDPATCPFMFHGGEIIDISGGGFASGASVALMLAGGRKGTDLRTLTAGATGAIATTVALPADLVGLPIEGQVIDYLEADGAGQDSTTRMDNVMFGVGTRDATCGVTPSLGVFLMGPVAPRVSTAGAVFAVTGPGLPPLGDPPTAGTFAEIDTTDDGAGSCPPREPTGVTCKDGNVGPLKAGATYTVTEVTAPAHLAAAAPQTVAVDQGIDGPDSVTVLNEYAGPPLPASARVNLLSPQGSAIPGGAVFAVTGPGLPTLTSPPKPGMFAEIDVRDGGWTDCPPHEPVGVDCAHGVIKNLRPGTPYLMTQIAAPAGYDKAPPQPFETSNDGEPVVVQSVVYPVAATTGHS